MTELLENFIRDNNLCDPEDIDVLLETAALTRQLLADGQYAEISALIRYTVENGCHEAFSWIMEILQEAFAKGPEAPSEFVCELGRSVPDYKELTERLAVDLRVLKNDVEAIPDEHGEVQSFFNIFTYRTGYPNIYLITAENFDTKDNDFIQYKLLFTGG